MRNEIVLLIFGAILAAGSFTEYRSMRRTLASDSAGVAQLGVQLKAVQSDLTRAASAADSATLSKQVKEREYYLGRRAYHLPFQQGAIDEYWRLTGSGTIMLFIGLAALGAGAGMAWRRRRAAGIEHMADQQ